MPHTVRQGILRAVCTVALLAAGVSRGGGPGGGQFLRTPGDSGQWAGRIDSRFTGCHRRTDPAGPGANPREVSTGRRPRAEARSVADEQSLVSGAVSGRWLRSSRSIRKSCTTRPTSLKTSIRRTPTTTIHNAGERQEMNGFLARRCRVHRVPRHHRPRRLVHPHADHVAPVEQAVEGAVRGAQQAAGPVHVERRSARLYADVGGPSLPRVGADSAARRAAIDGARRSRVFSGRCRQESCWY